MRIPFDVDKKLKCVLDSIAFTLKVECMVIKNGTCKELGKEIINKHDASPVSNLSSLVAA